MTDRPANAVRAHETRLGRECAAELPLRVGAVVLAAGESRRMRGIDKRRLAVDGEPLVRRWLRLLGDAGIRDIVVVLGHEPQRILPLIEGQGAVVVLNRDHHRGQQSSVVVGLAALPPEIDAAMVVLVDLALVDARDLRGLLDSFAARPEGTTALIPFFRGQRGNPVIVTAEVVAEVVAQTRDSDASAPVGEQSPEPGGLRAYLQSHPQQVFRHAADNDHFVVDLDTPEDIERLERRLGRALGRPRDEH